MHDFSLLVKFKILVYKLICQFVPQFCKIDITEPILEFAFFIFNLFDGDSFILVDYVDRFFALENEAADVQVVSF